MLSLLFQLGVQLYNMQPMIIRGVEQHSDEASNKQAPLFRPRETEWSIPQL